MLLGRLCHELDETPSPLWGPCGQGWGGGGRKLSSLPNDLLINGPDEITIRQDLALVVLGKRPADRALRVGRLLDMHTRRWHEDQEIVIRGRREARKRRMKPLY